MGDVAMTVPVLRALVLQHPDVKITMVSRPFFQAFFADIPNVNFFGVDLNQRHKGFVGLLRLFFDLRKLEVDLVADLHNVLRSKVVRTLFALSGKKVAATNKGRAEKKALTRLTHKDIAPLKPMVERHVDTFNQLGFSIDVSSQSVGTQFPEKAVLSEEIISFTGTKNKNWIGIAPFAQYESKVYPQDLMQQVIDALAENKNNHLFLFGGGPTEIQKLQQLQNKHDNVIVVAGKLAFEAEIQLISNLDVMLSMDSGNSHIAAMLGVKVITLWGATHPYAGFKPFNQPDAFCLTADRTQYPLLPTSIYGNKKVKGYDEVMRTILPSQVVEKINSNLT
jgi:ADP-heptose:LPS heptosyltransferase